MSLMFIIYLVFTAVPALKFMSGIVFIAWLIGIPVGMVIGAACRDISSDRTLWDYIIEDWIKKKWKVAFIFLLISKLIPNQEITSYMMAGYGVQKLAENETVQSMSADGVDVLKSMLAKAKRELKDDAKEETKK